MLICFVCTSLFQSTPSVGRATVAGFLFLCLRIFQSTPSVGRATCKLGIDFLATLISIHALRGEGDTINTYTYTGTAEISIHALRGEGDKDLLQYIILISISIHALRGEGDPPRTHKFKLEIIFQSTPSVGRATLDLSPTISAKTISIHALRGEGDGTARDYAPTDFKHFNPRPPWGGRLQKYTNMQCYACT